MGFGVAAELGGEIESVGGGGKGHIEEHEVDLVFTQQRLRLFGGFRLECDESFPAQLERKDAQDILLFVDDQNAAPHVRKFICSESEDQELEAF